MMNIETMTRGDLEVIIMEEDILPCNTSEELEAVQAKSDDELRDVVRQWIEDGDECA